MFVIILTNVRKWSYIFHNYGGDDKQEQSHGPTFRLHVSGNSRRAGGA